MSLKKAKKNMKWKSEECGQYVVSTPHAIPLVIPAGQHGISLLGYFVSKENTGKLISQLVEHSSAQDAFPGSNPSYLTVKNFQSSRCNTVFKV